MGYQEDWKNPKLAITFVNKDTHDSITLHRDTLGEFHQNLLKTNRKVFANTVQAVLDRPSPSLIVPSFDLTHERFGELHSWLKNHAFRFRYTFAKTSARDLYINQDPLMFRVISRQGVIQGGPDPLNDVTEQLLLSWATERLGPMTRADILRQVAFHLEGPWTGKTINVDLDDYRNLANYLGVPWKYLSGEYFGGEPDAPITIRDFDFDNRSVYDSGVGLPKVAVKAEGYVQKPGDGPLPSFPGPYDAKKYVGDDYPGAALFVPLKGEPYIRYSYLLDPPTIGPRVVTIRGGLKDGWTLKDTITPKGDWRKEGEGPTFLTFDIMALTVAEDLRDPATGDPLGRLNWKVGRCQVYDIKDQMMLARLTEPTTGTIHSLKPGTVVVYVGRFPKTFTNI